MDEKIANTIALHQMTINELKEMKNHVKQHLDDDVRFIVQTRSIFRTWEPYIITHKDKLDVSVYTINLVLDEVIKQEKERINKLIDIEIEKKLNK